MARLLKDFKCTQMKDKLVTGTLKDSDGQLSRDTLSSSIGITNIQVRQVQQEASSERRSQGPYTLLTSAQKFSIGKTVAENGITATLCYYSKTLQVQQGYAPLSFICQALSVATCLGIQLTHLSILHLPMELG